MPGLTIFDTFSAIRIGSISLSTIMTAIVALLFCILAMSIIKKICVRALENSKLDRAVKGFIGASLRVILWFITVIITADCLGIPVNSLVALLGVAGLALSLSVQSLLTNLFSGVTILATKPFLAGEFVEISSVSGTVCEVGLITTKLQTPDNRIILIPNGEVSASKIINYSRQAQRRVDLRFPVKHSCPSADIKALFLEIMSADSRILSDPEPFAALESFADGAFVYVIRAWTNNADYWSVYFDLNERVPEALIEIGASLTGKHLDVHISGSM